MTEPGGAGAGSAAAGGAGAGGGGAAAGGAGAGGGGAAAGGAGAGSAAAGGGVEWRRLDARVLALHVVRLLLALAPIAVVLVLGGDLSRSVTIGIAAIFGGQALAAGADALRWWTTRYRVTDERVELRSGLVQRSNRSVPRDRIRTVNLTAKPLHRLFSLTTVDVGTGRHGGSGEKHGLVLNAVASDEADRLRRELLARATAPPPAPSTAVSTPAAAEPSDSPAAASGPLAAAPGRSTTAAGTGTPAAAHATGTPAAVPATGTPAAVPAAGAPAAPGTGTPAAPGGGTPAAPATGTPGAPAAAPAGADAERLLVRLRWRWLPYDLLSPWTLALPLIVLGGGIQLLDTFGVEGVAFDAARDGADRVDAIPVLLAVGLLVVALVVVGALAASALFVESWWGFALVREPGGTLRVKRGLLTARSISIEQRRLRGVELAEPLLLRAAGGATLHAIATGLRSGDDGSSGRGARANALLPSVPRGEAEQVAAAVLEQGDVAAQLGELRPHPPVARRRRIVRALVAVAAVGAALLLAGPLLGWIPSWTPALALVLLGPALLLGVDAYRALGHRVAGGYLVTRHGTFVRRTHALERDGVIGWTVSRSPFQRRAGVVTVTATIAAGTGAYRIIDVDDGGGLAFAEEAVPGILAPFLVRSSATRTPTTP
ncbi:PH domain-containing protein [Conexibacter woesei]|uniref:Membrane-flanked domain protein n=1 Tax=Conexibacter woesei (strain DSM 14684 / CCUG 47730 / CIP 108061 / JCM 11494 / NBRC 100937 / ID131577) TaxID=469383 RepID=D3FAT8_CONWI|nr:PH domain-containing protein [Conexibacter woesei]ADB51251.1 membrane-flanked domain protein [Conexibacter woesei DSM 14684]